MKKKKNVVRLIFNLIRSSIAMLSILLAALAALGFLISVYFTLVFHKVMRADSKIIPRFCRLEEHSCQLILNTPDARVLGLPNFYLGIVYYAGLLGLRFDALLFHQVMTPLLIISGATVLLGVYLSYALLFKIKVPCVLCFASHAINFFIFILLIVQR